MTGQIIITYNDGESKPVLEFQGTISARSMSRLSRLLFVGYRQHKNAVYKKAHATEMEERRQMLLEQAAERKRVELEKAKLVKIAQLPQPAPAVIIPEPEEAPAAPVEELVVEEETLDLPELTIDANTPNLEEDTHEETDEGAIDRDSERSEQAGGVSEEHPDPRA